MDSLKEMIDTVRKGLSTGEPTIVGILLAIFVVLLTIVYFGCKRGVNRRRGVLLLGLSESGKTTVFMQLVHKKFVETVTSMKPNTGIHQVMESGKQLSIIDLPGFERIRLKYLDDNKGLARGIMFIIDSVTFQKEIKDVAEFLYTLLSDSVLSSMAPPVLIVCNKQDTFMAKGSMVIQAQLEKEMNTVRITRSGALESTDGITDNIFLGSRDHSFAFADLKPYKVTFCECSAKGSGTGSVGDIDEVKHWLRTLA